MPAKNKRDSDIRQLSYWGSKFQETPEYCFQYFCRNIKNLIGKLHEGVAWAKTLQYLAPLSPLAIVELLLPINYLLFNRSLGKSMETIEYDKRKMLLAFSSGKWLLQKHWIWGNISPRMSLSIHRTVPLAKVQALTTGTWRVAHAPSGWLHNLFGDSAFNNSIQGDARSLHCVVLAHCANPRTLPAQRDTCTERRDKE